mmetsp:Transcript_26662/g.80043  ORF Transcript_26662/g.80043 Transcript_26662/m.80043 type:complete len:257 (-) Transcript_26662:125-895(-)
MCPRHAVAVSQQTGTLWHCLCIYDPGPVTSTEFHDHSPHARLHRTCTVLQTLAGDRSSKSGGTPDGLAQIGVGFFSPTSPGNPWQWVHMGTFAHFGLAKCCDEAVSQTKPCCCCTESERKISVRCHRCEPIRGRPALRLTHPTRWLGRTMCNGALIGFSRSGLAYDRVLLPWFECALDRGCIAPVYGQGRGSVSTRGNHRQDQAALTLLAHFANMSCHRAPHTTGVALHHDKVNDNTICRRLRTSGALPQLPDHSG